MKRLQAPQKTLDLARQVLRIESEAVLALQEHIGDSFRKAVELVLDARGRVIVCGVGKSGHIGRKIASTLASTGTAAFFVHPVEASHGDLGMIQPSDVVIAISNSGESSEVLAILPSIKRQGTALIAITGNPQSTLAKDADVSLYAGVTQEACPLNLAPTASTTATLALGDALSVALLSERGFGAEDFARSHPGGALGRRLLTRVSDVMRTGSALPAVSPSASVIEAVGEISRSGLGMTIIVSPDKKVMGIFTDGDLRRAIVAGKDFRALSVADLMTRRPQCITPDKLAAEAVERMEKYRINQIPVVDGNDNLVGALNMHDLFQAKAI